MALSIQEAVLRDIDDHSSIRDVISSSYELDIFPQPGLLRCQDEPTTLYPINVPDSFANSVRITNTTSDCIEWEFLMDEHEGNMGSLVSSSRTIKEGIKYKHRHDFVCEAFSVIETDVPMRLIKELNDEDDNRTPDIIMHHNNIYNVIEIATCRSDNERIIKHSFDTKIFSYKHALENRCLRDIIITFTVIVVSRNYVLSSHYLPQTLVNELIARMRIALALEQHAEAIGLDLEDDERSEFKNTIKKKISKEIDSIKHLVIDDHPLNIDSDFIEQCLTEPDEKEVSKKFVKELVETRLEIEQMIKQKNDELVDEYISKYNKGERRSDRKPVTFMPYIIADEKPHTSDITKKSISESSDLPAVTKLWSKAMDYYELKPEIHEEDPTTMLNEALEEDIGTIRYMEKERSKKKKSYHRVDLRNVLTREEEEQLALQGLWAKKHTNEDFMKARRKHQQSGFRWNTPVDDIGDYLTDTSCLDPIMFLKSDEIDLLEEAEVLAENSNKGIDSLRAWRNTKLFQSLDIISDISYEVAIANKQHCRSREMILKKLRKYDIYLLISPTKSSEHTFVSIYLPSPGKICHQGVFGRMCKVSGGYVSDFFSIKQSKLENLSSMPAALFSLSSFWSWYCKIVENTPENFRLNREALLMLKFSLLVRLEDKAQTEETITLTRYMYMEVFKSIYALTPPNPYKILSKMSDYPRSRLNLFCIKRIISTFQMMDIVKPTRISPKDVQLLEEGEDSVPNDGWNNLLNWVSGNRVPTASRAINLFYLGYLKNKMESPEGNTDFQLIEKTCEEEFKLDWSEMNKSKGDDSTERPKGKQFNLNCIKHGCSVMESRLKAIYGNLWRSIVHREILDSLTSKLTLEVATLKASSSIDHRETQSTSKIATDISSHRIKVIEAVCENLESMGVNPMMNIRKILRHIETTSKGVVCDLFKKQQHGGLREIYVLTIESRIVQLFIETISRTLCSYFPEETLTHPKNKLKRLDEHRSTSARIANREQCVYADFCSSTDKTRWNQNFVMPAMAIPLIRLTNFSMHPIIQRILNLWTHKLIKIPQRVINLLLNSVEMKSDTYNKLHEMFWSKKRTRQNVFDIRCGEFIRLSSGMMQGILHYTSSLLHLCFLNSMNSTVMSLLKKIYKHHTFRITQVCSSDDSATILTVFSQKGSRNLDEDTILVCKKITQVLEALNNMAPYYCMFNSVKTTTSLIDYIEFNSEFLLRNTIAIPIIKFLAASLNLTESESFMERFHTMYNLISDLFSSGFPAYNTHICQLAQGFNHYKTMGSSVNILFSHWKLEIVKIPDPILGFFLVDTEMCPGALGYSFSHWKAVKNSNIFRRSVKSILSDAVQVNDSGGIIQTLILKYGDVKRWRKLVDKISQDIDFRLAVENDPEILFKSPKTISELRVALALKATMPAVAKSFRRGNPYMQALAMSVYAISTHCFSKTTVTTDMSNKVLKQTEKVSLLGELRSRQEQLADSDPPTKEDIETSFPSQDRYIEACKIITHLKTFSLVSCPVFRHRRTELMVQPFTTYLPLSLLQTCQAIWFGYKVKTSSSILKRCYLQYKSKLPWLRDTIHETLQHSPFVTYQELANFVSSHALRTRAFVRVGPGLYSKRFSGQLFQLIRKSQLEGYVLKGIPAKRMAQPSGLISRISLALSLPLKDKRISAIKHILKSTPLEISNLADINKMTKREASLAYIHGYIKGEFTKDEIISNMQQTGNGMIFSYTKMQDRRYEGGKLRWLGHGQCHITAQQVSIIVNMTNDIATSIEISSFKKIKPFPSTLTTILKELGLRPIQDKSIGVGAVAKFDGEHWLLPSGCGIPVIESRILSPRTREIDFRLQIGYQNISLIQNTPRGPASIIRFKTYPGDITLDMSHHIDIELSSCWLNQKSIKMPHGIAWILAASTSKDSTLRDWIKDTLSSRLIQMGMTKCPSYQTDWYPRIDIEEPLDETDISDEELTKLFLEMLDEQSPAIEQSIKMFKESEEKILTDETLSVEEGPQWAFVMHNWIEMEMEENIDITSKNVKSFNFLHPFWDDTINKISNNFPDLWSMAFKGIIHPNYKELSRAIIKLYNIKPRAEEAPVQEKVKRLVPSIVKIMEEHQKEEEMDIEEEESIAGEEMPGPSKPRKDEEPSWAEMAEEESEEEWFG